MQTVNILFPHFTLLQQHYTYDCYIPDYLHALCPLQFLHLNKNTKNRMKKIK